MTGWQLEPEEIIRVLNDAGAARTKLERAIRPKDVEAVVDGIFWDGYATALIAPLAQAVADLSALQGKHLQGIATLVDVGLSGLTNTTLSYQAGMHDMAVETQREMLRAADVLDSGDVLGQIPDQGPRRPPHPGPAPGRF